MEKTVKSDTAQKKIQPQKKETALRCYVKYVPYIILVFGFLFLQAFSELQLPDYMADIVNLGIAKSNISVVWQKGGFMILYAFVSFACSIIVAFLSAFIGSRATADVREKLFKKVSAFSSAEFDKLSVASLITRCTNDLTQIQMFMIMFIRIALYAPVLAVGGIIKASQRASGIGPAVYVIIAAIAIIVLTMVILIFIVQPRFIKIQKLMDKLNLTARENLNGMMVVRAFSNQEFNSKRFNDVNNELKNSNLFVNRTLSILQPLISTLMMGVSIAIVWIASLSAADMTVVGNMMAFIQYAIQIIISFMMVVMIFMIMPRAIVSMRRVNEALNNPLSIFDVKDAQALENVKGEIEFKNVTFYYGQGEEPAIKDISFKALPNQTTAIIGSTGSGKSTLANLVARLYDASEGEILLDGVNIKNVKLESLRNQIAFIPQKNVLFSGTIESNIKFADQNISDEQMQKAAEIAQAKEFIEEYDLQYKTAVTQGGTNFSGGQRQRLAIARAIVKNSPVYVFDDSFSALDFKTDSKLRQALKENLNAAFIIVAQRVGTIMNADQILVLDEGRLVGKGTHEQLLKECSVYYEIANSQLSAEELGL